MPGLATLEKLEKEIAHTHANIQNAFTMRADHPSYGYTKTGIRRDLARMEGLIAAHAIMTGKAPANPFAIVPEYAARFGIDIKGLSAALRG